MEFHKFSVNRFFDTEVDKVRAVCFMKMLSIKSKVINWKRFSNYGMSFVILSNLPVGVSSLSQFCEELVFLIEDFLAYSKEKLILNHNVRSDGFYLFNANL
jgi:hypothetical protein